MESIKIREASYADFGGIISLLGRHNMQFSDKDAAQLRHIWQDNPSISGCDKHWPMGWLLEKDGKETVGFIGNIPLAYQLNGRQVIAACMSSWVVDHAYRRYSAQLILRYLAQESADILLNPNTSNRISYKFFTAFRGKEVLRGSYDRVFYRIINYRHFAASVFRKMHIPFSNFFSMPMSALQFFADAGKDAENISCISSFDERFDTFWQELKKDNNTFLSVRDRKSLNWHFKHALLRKEIWIFITEKSSRITSYAVFLRQDSPGAGLRRMRLADFQSLGGDASVLKDMVLYAVKKCREDDIDVLEALGFNQKKRLALKQLGLRERRLACRHFFYRAKGPALARELQNPDLWDPCLFDSDASL